MKKLLIILFFVGMFFTNLISAEIQTLPSVKQGEAVQLPQVCANCTYVNITSVRNPNSQIILSNQEMTKDGTMYSYTLNNTNIIGEYVVTGVGDVDGIDTVFTYNFYVTPSGRSGNANLVFIVFLIIFFYFINLFGFIKGNAPLTLLGGLSLLFLGVYTINEGITIYRDNLTIFFSYITIAWGSISSIAASYSLYQEM